MKLLMLKLSATLFLSSSLFAASNAEVASFLQKNIGKNPNISDLKIEIVDKQPMREMKTWDAFVVQLSAKIKQGKETKSVSQRMIYFASGDFITSDLTNMKTSKSLKERVTPEFKAEFYAPKNLIYGNANAKHKVAIFSDPLCPYCRNFVPGAIEYMKKYPKTFAIYYYHFPLERIHPASVALTRAALVAEHHGRKDIVLNMYKVAIDAHEKNEQKIVDAFNKALGTKITVAELHSKAVEEQVKFDNNVITTMMVVGTPTIFFDGIKDKSKKKYKTIKVN